MDREATIPTTLAGLADFLREEGYHPSAYHIGAGPLQGGDAYCLEQTPAGFEAFHVERGLRSDPFWVEPCEHSACRAFVALLDRDSTSRSHCIAFTGNRSEIEMIERDLATEGIRTRRNDIPAFGGSDDPRFRLFVEGRDKKRVDLLVEEGRIPAVSFG